MGLSGFAVSFQEGRLQATWDSTSVPDGGSVVLQFLDAAGTPLLMQPLVTYSAGSAIVAGAPQEGEQFYVRAQVLSTFTEPQVVTVHSIGAVTAVGLTWRGGALHASWTLPTGGPFSYRFQLLDGGGQPLIDQPSFTPEGETGTAISGDDLTDGATYQISVQAEQDRSLGAATLSVAIQIDKSQPDSDLLRALLTRLQEADRLGRHAFALSPELVQAANVTSFFGSLLGQSANTLPLTAVELGSTPTSVTLIANADYPFALNRSTAFVFTEAEGQLVVHLTVTDLGSFTVRELINKRILPGSSFAPGIWAAGLAAFPQLQMTLDSQTGALTFSGSPTTEPWSIDIGLAGVALGAVTPAIQILAPSGSTPKRYLPHVRTTLTLDATTRFPVLLQLPSGLDGFVITLGDPTGVPVGDLAHFNALMGGAHSGLPTEVISQGSFKLTQLRFAFAPNPDTWHLRALFSVGPESGATWELFGGLVKLTGLSAGIDLTLFLIDSAFEVIPSGYITGTLMLRDALTVSAAVAGPDSDGLWSLTGSAAIENVRLGALANYLGGSATPLSNALTRLGTVDSLSLNAIAMQLALSGERPGLRSLSVGFDVASWTVPSLPWFAIDEVNLRFDIQNPTLSSRVVTGSVGGLLTLGGAQLAVNVDFGDEEAWHLQLAAFAAQLSGLDQLSDVLPTSAITSFLPNGLETKTTFGLADLRITYNTADGFIAEASFALLADTSWSWLGGLLTLWSIAIHLDAVRSSKEAGFAITGSIGGAVELGGALFNLMAQRQRPDEPWSFTGGLADAYTVEFSEVLQQLDPSLALPVGYGLPTSVTLEVTDLTYVPESGQLDFYSQGTVDWFYQFGGTTVAITALGGELHLPAGGGKFTGALNGDFTIGALKGLALLSLGESETVIQVEIGTEEQASAVGLIDAVIGAGSYAGLATPTGFVTPTTFARAGLSVNLTKSSLLLTGEYAAGEKPLYGALALLMAKDALDKWGYVLAGALQNWSLTDLSPALAGIDAIGLTKVDAAIALSTLDSEAGAQVAAAIPVIGARMAIRPGLNLFARLDFSDGWLANVAQFLVIQGPYTIGGHLPVDPTEAVTLTSTLGGLKLNTLDFNNILLTYVRTPAKGQVSATDDLRLTGALVATLDKAYTFQGDLHITSTKASFEVTTDHSVVSPLGIPGITLAKLGFAFQCDFGGGTTSNTDTAFYGQVSFTDGTNLQGLVGMQKGTATLVLVRLLTPKNHPAELSIGSLYSQTTLLPWPGLNVKLANGQLWYVPGATAITYRGQRYAAGFHASAETTILFLPTITLSVDIDSGPTKALTAAAQFAAPIDWSFIKFTGTAGHGGAKTGPFVTIDTQADLPFTLGAGLTLLGAEVGDVTIDVGSDKMTGRLTLPESTGIFSGSSLEFTWDEEGFHVPKWPLQDLELPSFDMENIKGAGSCDQVIMELLPIDSKFDLDVALSIQPPKDGAPAMLGVTLNGHFDLVVTSSAYANDPLLRAEIGDVKISIPFPSSGGYDWERLKESFVEAIKTAGESIIQKLVLDPVNLAKLSGVVGAKWAFAKMVDYLFCSGLPREVAEANVALASSAEVGTAVTCLGATVAVGGVVGTIVGGSIVNDSNKPDPQLPKPAQPGKPTLTFDVDHLAISWSTTDPANTKIYAIALSDQEGNPVALSSVSGTSTTVPVGALKLGRTYKAKIIAAGPGGRSAPSEPGSLYLLPAPGAPTLNFNDPDLGVDWIEVTGAKEYALQVLDGKGAPVPKPDFEIKGTRASVRAEAFAGGGSFTVQVQAIALGVVSPWSQGTSVTIALLPAPLGLTAFTLGNGLKVSWQPTPGAISYIGGVTDPSGRGLLASIAFDGATATITGPAIVDGAELLVMIKGEAPGFVGRSSMPLPVRVNLLPIPAITDHLYRSADKSLVMKLNTTPKTSVYEFEMRDSKGQRVSPAGISMTDGRAELDASNLAPGSYTIRAQAVAGNDRSDWSPTVTIQILNLEAPTGLILVSKPTYLASMWAPVTGATGYVVQVLDQDGRPLRPQPRISREGTSATIIPPKPDATYRVQVCARALGVVGPFGAPVSVTWARSPAWSTMGHDAQRTSRSALHGPTSPTERWSVQLDYGIVGFLAIARDGTVIVPTDLWMIGFSPDGTERWRQGGSTIRIYSPSIGPDDSIYYGTADGVLNAVDANGNPSWASPFANMSGIALAISADGTIYTGTDGVRIGAFRPDGAPKWIHDTKGNYESFTDFTLATDGSLYAGGPDQNLYAFSPEGALKWKFQTGGAIYASPTVGADGTIYIGAADNRFYAITPDGSQRWAYSVPASDALGFSSPALGVDATIYVHASDDNLYALSPDGRLKWQKNLGPATDCKIQGQPSVDAAGTIYVGNESGTLYALKPDGSVLWSKQLGPSIRSTPTIGPDRSLYIYCFGGRLYALGQAT